MERVKALGDVGSTVAAATAGILAQTGVEPWIPLIITIVNGIFLLLQGKKAMTKARREKKAAEPAAADLEPAEK